MCFKKLDPPKMVGYVGFHLFTVVGSCFFLLLIFLYFVFFSGSVHF